MLLVTHSSQLMNLWNLNANPANCHYKANWHTVKSFVSIDCPVNQEGALPTCCNVWANSITPCLAVSRAYGYEVSLQLGTIMCWVEHGDKIGSTISSASVEIMLIRYLASAEVKGRLEQAASISPHNWEEFGFNCIINLVKLSYTEVRPLN